MMSPHAILPENQESLWKAVESGLLVYSNDSKWECGVEAAAVLFIVIVVVAQVVCVWFQVLHLCLCILIMFDEFVNFKETGQVDKVW